MKDINLKFHWVCHPDAEKLILDIQELASSQSFVIKTLEKELLVKTSTRLFDWLDHVAAPKSKALEKRVLESGFTVAFSNQALQIFHHLGAKLPRVVLYEDKDSNISLAISVESIADFLRVRGVSRKINGSPFSPYRSCVLSTENKVELQVIERRGAIDITPLYLSADFLEKSIEGIEDWKSRPRDLNNPDKGLDRAIEVAKKLVKTIGQDLSACIVLKCEREYWQTKNRAGQIQKNRQDTLGLGWANHDHHTFRSSRKHFSKLVYLFEILGFHCRERFYAGLEAGWGAQVMEHTACGLVLFLDVDLTEEEVAIDFSHNSLPEKKTLGTIGLWCALHGDSILKSGMHHLEAQFLFEELKKDLNELEMPMMDPFSFFPYLKQAFTKGEIWPVDKQQIKDLVNSKQITEKDADKFQREGAIGSHLENLQRREGYKGFNQKNVSFIINKTDPRKN